MSQPTKLPPDDLRLWATHAIAAHPGDLAAALAAHFSVSRMAASTAIKQLELEGFVLRVRGGTRPLFQPGPSRLVAQEFKLPGLDESLVWEQAVQPVLGELAAPLSNIVHYGLTEMVNNANDHSVGSTVQLRCAVTPEAVHLWITDDGVGVFEKLRSTLHLADVRLALLELTKGKVTTDPKRHSGEGLFFTSRAFTRFELTANGLVYKRLHQARQQPVLERLEPMDGGGPSAVGTQVFLSLQRDATHTLRQVFDQHTTGAPDDLSFDRTVVPVKLARVGTENLLSRSQARRLLSRVEGFRVVELDFEGIDEIGQAFADELFRVFVNEHPQIDLRPLHVQPRVAAMIRRVGSGS